MEKVSNIKTSLVGYHPDRNYSRINPNYTDFDSKRTELLMSVTRRGWLPEKTVVCYKDDKLAAEIFTDLESKLAALETAEDMVVKNPLGDGKITLSKADQIAGFLAHYGDGKKLIAPKLIAVWGYRRNSVGWIGKAIRLKANQPVNNEMQVIERTFKNILEIQKACVLENMDQKTGVLTLGVPDMLDSARKMFEEGCSQKAIRDIYKDGTGTKIYNLLWLDAAFKMDMVDKCIKDPKLFGPLGQSKLTPFRTAKTLVDEFDQGIVSIDGEKITEETIQEARAKGTAEAVEAYFRTPKTGKNEVKMANKDKIKQIATASKVDIIKAVLNAVKIDDLDTINAKYNVAFKEINAAIEKIMDKVSK